jgi:hypothetical protein
MMDAPMRGDIPARRLVAAMSAYAQDPRDDRPWHRLSAMEQQRWVSSIKWPPPKQERLFA